MLPILPIAAFFLEFQQPKPCIKASSSCYKKSPTLVACYRNLRKRFQQQERRLKPATFRKVLSKDHLCPTCLLVTLCTSNFVALSLVIKTFSFTSNRGYFLSVSLAPHSKHHDTALASYKQVQRPVK